MSTVPTTELEAVNIILEWNGDNPVSSLTDQDNLALTKAQAVLTEQSRRYQLAGLSFNTDYNYPLNPDAQSNVPFPSNALMVDPSAKSGDVDYVERGRKFYDRRNHTFTITSTVYVDIVWFLPFDELPEHARQYFTMEAAKTFLSRDLADPSILEVLNEQLMWAKRQFLRVETKVMDLSIKKKESMKHIIDPGSFHPQGRSKLNIH